MRTRERLAEVMLSVNENAVGETVAAWMHGAAMALKHQGNEDWRPNLHMIMDSPATSEHIKQLAKEACEAFTSQ